MQAMKKMKTLIKSLMVAVLPVVCFSQGLKGTLMANDTKEPIPSAVIRAVQQRGSLSQPPAIFQAETNSTGGFTLAVPAGLYRLCVGGAGSYVDPCHWGNALIVTAPSAAVVTVQVLRGVQFIVRLHDVGGFLPQVEVVKGGGVSVILSGGPGGPFPLPIIYDDGRVRDFGDLLPLNAPLVASASSAHVSLVDQSGATVGAAGVPFQITAADFAVNPILPVGSMFQPPKAKMIHIYTSGVH